MSQKSDGEENAGIEEITENLSESSTSEAVSQEIPQAPDLRGAIEQDLQKKIDAGENLSVRTVYTRIYNEIAEANKCSYAYVAKLAKAFLKKKSEPEASTTKVDNNKIEIQTVAPVPRPPPQAKKKTLENLVENIEVDHEKNKLDLEFEIAMLEMSFDNIAGIIRIFGIPAPQAKKIKHQAKLIAMFNQRMIATGHPEEVIDMGSKLLPWMLKISTVGMFAEPIGKVLMKLGDKKKEDAGIIEETKSMRD